MIKLETNHGDITLRLNAEAAPNTCANFQHYVTSGFFDDTLFHRVIPGFMIQGGGFSAGMQKKDTEAAIQNEANNGLANTVGSIAMARTADPHSATSQFFINVNNNDFLNHTREDRNGWGYCVFGEVVDGMDVVNTISQLPTGSAGMHQDVPVEDVVILRASVIDEA